MPSISARDFYSRGITQSIRVFFKKRDPFFPDRTRYQRLTESRGVDEMVTSLRFVKQFSLQLVAGSARQ